MKLTSGFNFENYEITDYLGFCSGEYALNTKFLSDFNLLSSYSEKLEAAQKNALDLLISNAKQMGANAIIGLDIDYTTDDHDISIHQNNLLERYLCLYDRCIFLP